MSAPQPIDSNLVPQIMHDLRSLDISPAKRQTLRSFFKTGKGQYAENDNILGIPIGEIRKIANKYSQATLSQLDLMLKDDVHEVRLCALIILVEQFANAAKDSSTQGQQRLQSIFDFYITHAHMVNNWDLVDLSAPKIVGNYLLLNPNHEILYSLVQSPILWLRRIAIVSTLPLIKKGHFTDIFNLSEALLCDKQDLLHKAIGWMLREVGKIDHAALEHFLDKHASIMPRTALRYALEQFPSARRQYYMRKGQQ